MLETLVPSRIRRALLEHILRHSQDRFYLRGLAKELGLSVTPLRRELKRLERSGMLRTFQEGNIVFYTVNASSPEFLQLRNVELAPGQPERPMPSAPPLIPVGVVSAPSAPSVWRSPMFIGAAGMGLALVVIVAALLVFTVSEQRMVSRTSRPITARTAEVTVVMPPKSSASNAMRGSRWQVVPGGFGGFSSGAEPETY
jgi:hypothetical protein